MQDVTIIEIEKQLTKNNLINPAENPVARIKFAAC